MAGNVSVADLHPCRVTGTPLTLEDCDAAQYWLDQARRGTAAFDAPTRMFEGQVKLVTLAIGTAPPQPVPPPPAEASVEPSTTSRESPETSGAKPENPPASPTPHETVAESAEPSSQIVDYHPFVGRQMAADLLGDGFDIKLLSPRVQPVSDDGVTTWEWQVRARVHGKRKLIMKTSVVMIDSQEKPHALVPTTRSRSVAVWIGPPSVLAFIKDIPDWLKAIAAVVAGVGAVLAAWRGIGKARQS